MSIHSLPPELLLYIFQLLYRDAVCNLRLVSKDICEIVTPLLFKNVNVHYGIDRALEQMRGFIGEEKLRGCIRDVMIPSESFVVNGDGFQFHEKTFWWSVSVRGEPVVDGYYDAETEGQAVKTGALAEYPHRRDVRFDPTSRTFKRKIEDYERCLERFLVQCERLERIWIAFGAGWTSGRMEWWGGVVGRVVRKVCEGGKGGKGVKRLDLLVPRVGCLESFLKGVSGEGVFESLEGVSVDIYAADPAFRDLAAIESSTNDLFTKTPNLRSCQLSTNYKLTRTNVPPLFPLFSGNGMLTSLSIRHTFFPIENDSAFDRFSRMLASTPGLLTLEMTACMIQYSDSLGRDAERILSDELNIASFENLPARSWAGIFKTFETHLINLRSFKFGHLMYGRHRGSSFFNDRSTHRAEMLVPAEGRFGGMGVKEFSRSVRSVEGVSPYVGDHEELERFRRVVAERGGLNETRGGFEGGQTWRFL
ncbi:hypothetical protein TWF481_001235 [Arthrobotrys musiformis]|uniref:F-box domain-containing protein n=1 Tax=Arthrobotrys musiformis TaxID=47236 RepID=A0AAV9WPY3_9PEZI